jgi:hypothetical protein
MKSASKEAQQHVLSIVESLTEFSPADDIRAAQDVSKRYSDSTVRAALCLLNAADRISACWVDVVEGKRLGGVRSRKYYGPKQFAAPVGVQHIRPRDASRRTPPLFAPLISVEPLERTVSAPIALGPQRGQGYPWNNNQNDTYVELRAEILGSLAARPKTKAELARVLYAKRSSSYGCVGELLRNGTLRKSADGVLYVFDAADAPAHVFEQTAIGPEVEILPPMPTPEPTPVLLQTLSRIAEDTTLAADEALFTIRMLLRGAAK